MVYGGENPRREGVLMVFPLLRWGRCRFGRSITIYRYFVRYLFKQREHCNVSLYSTEVVRLFIILLRQSAYTIHNTPCTECLVNRFTKGTLNIMVCVTAYV